MIDADDHIAIVDFSAVGQGDMCFDLFRFGYDGTPMNIEMLCLDKKTSKQLNRYHVLDALMVADELYALVKDGFLYWSSSNMAEGKPATFIELGVQANGLLAHQGRVYLYKNKIYSRMPRGEAALALYQLEPSTKSLREIYADSPSDRYLYFFNSPKHFALHDSGIFLMAMAEPRINRLDFHGNLQQSFQTAEIWNAVSPEEAEQLVDVAYKDPNLIFSRLGDRLLDELSHNTRIELIDDEHLSLLYFPGQDAQSNLNMHLDIYKIQNDELSFHKRLESMGKGISENQPNFHFPMHPSSTYFIKDGKHYQIGVIPAGTLGMEGEERSRKWIQSLDANHFELCLFIGHYNLD